MAVCAIANDDGGQGVLASVYGGYDFQVLPRALVGVLAEGTWSGIQSNASAQVPGASASVSTQPNLGWSSASCALAWPDVSVDR